jgi:hypothetical protein
MKTKIKASVMGIAVLLVLIGAVPAAVDATAVKVVPASQVVHAGENFSINIAIENVTNMKSDQAILNFDPSAMNAVEIIEGDFLKSGGTTLPVEKINNTEGTAGFAYTLLPGGTPLNGSGVLATIKFNTSEEAEGTFNLILTEVMIKNTTAEVPVHVYNGTVEIVTPPPLTPVLDTGSGTYPSISGTHNGTIKPNQTITVYKMYSYPCPGTGGHSEYVRIWNKSGTITEGNWTGYGCDWHNISFNKPFILKANESYNYTLRTGSYPQIIHKQNHTTLDGSLITCEEFIDANGKIYGDWIPAIKFFPKLLSLIPELTKNHALISIKENRR